MDHWDNDFSKFINSEEFVEKAFNLGRLAFFDDKLTSASFKNPYNENTDSMSQKSWKLGWIFSQMLWDSYLHETFMEPWQLDDNSEGPTGEEPA